jgi:hypothetical protein
MLKHGAITHPELQMLKHKSLQLTVRADTVKSAIHVAEIAHELRC